MKKPEILSPAGSLETVKAAVLNGANAIYMGLSNFNARRNAKNFTDEEAREAIDYCHERGVLVYITTNTVIYDREKEAFVSLIKKITKMGADGVIVQDFGMARLIKKISPYLSLHGSTQMTVHSLDGALACAKMGVERIVLSRELSYEEISHITKNCGIETEVFIHGALCMSYSGQCYMSGILGGRSGNRGYCAGACRLPYKDGTYPLSLKDLSLLNHLQKLQEVGVSCLKIEGRMKRPEYVALVTNIVSRVLNEHTVPTKEENKMLEEMFSRDGFTDGYFKNRLGENMFGVKTEPNYEKMRVLFEKTKKTYEKEKPLIPIKFSFEAQENLDMKLVLSDESGNNVQVTEEPPQIALKRPTSEEEIKKALQKTGGTPYYAQDFDINTGENLMISLSQLNKMRRKALEKLSDIRRKPIERTITDYNENVSGENQTFSGYTVSVTKMWQITDYLIENPPHTLYIPVFELVSNTEKVTELLEKNINIVMTLPRIITSKETSLVEEAIKTAKECAVDTALCSNIGQIELCERMDINMFSDYGFNITNSSSLLMLKEKNILRSTLSFELKYAMIRDIRKCVDTEILVYGYLPVMIFENCLIKSKSKGKCTCKSKTTELIDRMGEHFALLPEFEHRNTMLNSKPLYTADKKEDFEHIGVKYARLMFTIEKPSEVDNIYSQYIFGVNNPPENFTRGLYYRGVN